MEATGKLILKHKLSVVITEKHLTCKCFFKGHRGGRVDDFGTQGVVKFRPLVKNGKLFDVSSTEMWVGSLLCSKRFFSRYSGFPLSSKTNISKFQFDPGNLCTDISERVLMNSLMLRG